MNGQELLRMGFTRMNFAYFLKDEDIEYMLKAMEFVAEYGWMFLPHYKFDEDLGTWTNRDELEQKQRSWLGEIDYSEGFMNYTSSQDESLRGKYPFFNKRNCSNDLEDYLAAAKENLVRCLEQYKIIYGKSMIDQKLLVPEEY